MKATDEIELFDADFTRLAQMRAGFLATTDPDARGGATDYWRSRRDLEIYDATFGARIGWKWDAVLVEIARLGLTPPAGTIVDWACGTGRAARAWLEHCGSAASLDVRLHDRSAAAARFARELVESAAPGVTIRHDVPNDPDVLLVSHVLGELDTAALDELCVLASRSRFVVWVESGDKSTARALSAVRERLVASHEPLAPCTHARACGVLGPGHEGDWCHHFARPAPEAFTTRHWARFSHELKIDLRALPYSYLVLATRDSAAPRATGLTRILGRPEMQKGRALLAACDETGVATLRLLERTNPKMFDELDDAAGIDLRFRIEADGARVRSIERPTR